MDQRPIIEICCDSADDVVAAFQAGAHRAELNCALPAGGLTPSPGALEAAKERADIPVVCMVRPRAGGFCYSELEFETMLRDIRALARAGADGFAFGCLTQEGTIDRERCARLVEAAGDGEAVFHRAFDALDTPLEEDLELLISLGVTRVLTSGRRPTAPEGAGTLRRCVEYAGGRLEILAGGGVRPWNAQELLEETGCDQLHCTFHRDAFDRSTARSGMRFNAPAHLEETVVRVVDGEGLSKFVRSFRESPL